MYYKNSIYYVVYIVFMVCHSSLLFILFRTPGGIHRFPKRSDIWSNLLCFNRFLHQVPSSSILISLLYLCGYIHALYSKSIILEKEDIWSGVKTPLWRTDEMDLYIGHAPVMVLMEHRTLRMALMGGKHERPVLPPAVFHIRYMSLHYPHMKLWRAARGGTSASHFKPPGEWWLRAAIKLLRETSLLHSSILFSILDV